MLEEKKEEAKGLSRRDFLKDAGLVVGGATIGSLALVNACKTDGATATVTNTATTTKTVTGAAGATVTVSQAAATTTVTAAGASKFVCQIEGQEFATLDALKAHISANHPSLNAADSSVVLTVNGVAYGFMVQPHWSLAFLLREKLGLFGLKEGCQCGECGCCAVIVDDKSVYSCLMFAIEMNGKNVVTIEGLSNNGKLGKVQQKFYDQDVAQCGFCTPGFIMAAEALYKTSPKPNLDEVREAVAGHICMCGNVHRSVNCIVGGV